jgi:hypothetical protein
VFDHFAERLCQVYGGNALLVQDLGNLVTARLASQEGDERGAGRIADPDSPSHARFDCVSLRSQTTESNNIGRVSMRRGPHGGE